MRALSGSKFELTFAFRVELLTLFHCCQMDLSGGGKHPLKDLG